MPFTFWKKFRLGAKSTVPSDAAVAKELRMIIPPTPGKPEVDFEDHDSGVFLFDEDAEEFSVPSLIDHALAAADSTPLMLQVGAWETPKITTSLEQDVEVCIEESQLDGIDALLNTRTISFICEQPLRTEPGTIYHLPAETQSSLPPAEHTGPSMDTTWPSQSPLATASIQSEMKPNEGVAQHTPYGPSTHQSSISAGISTVKFPSRDRSQSRDSGVYMCDT